MLKTRKSSVYDSICQFVALIVDESIHIHSLGRTYAFRLSLREFPLKGRGNVIAPFARVAETE